MEPHDLQRLVADFGRKPKALQIFRVGAPSVAIDVHGREQRSEVESTHLRRGDYIMCADFDRSNVTELVQAFREWAHGEVKRLQKAKRGKAAAAPAHKLKALAALRLRKAGLSYEQAQKFIREKAQNKGNPLDILPAYASQGAWQGACEKAEAEIASMRY